ncbi:MAG TPA: patatin-like phospholipase family protein [Gemmataceae bacterium]|jgi:predicted acylesterase/phospholipase RssA
MSIRLAFSGGGFRATLLHLGVLRYLRQSGRLENGGIEAICSVSGGSILAAHLVLNWDKYTGEPQDFQNATTELIEFARRDVRGRILRAWVFWWSLVVVLWIAPVSLIPYCVWSFNSFIAALSGVIWFVVGLLVIARYKHFWSLIRALERQYNSYLYRVLRQPSGRPSFGTAVLADLEQSATAPSLHILTTNLTTGELCSFDGRGFHVYTAEGQRYNEQVFNQNQLPIGRAVAASSAFPVLFSPVRLSDRTFGAPTFSHPQMLADGGIFENFGLEGFAAVYSDQPWPRDCTLLLSDGQAVFNPEDLRTFALLNSRASRTIDVLMHRVSLWQLNQAIQSTVAASAEVQPAPVASAAVSMASALPAPDNSNAARAIGAANPAANPIATANLVAVASAAARFEHFSLATNVEGAWALSPPLQNRIARTRTDLDAFSNAEIHLLVYQGFCAARAVYEPATQNGTLGEQRLPPGDAYTDGWSPTAPISNRVSKRLNKNKLDKVLGRPSRSRAVLKELFAPLNWATLLVVVIGLVPIYLLLSSLLNWWVSRQIYLPNRWTSRPVQVSSLPLRFVERVEGERAEALLKEQPAINDLWYGIGPSCAEGCKIIVLQSKKGGEITNGHPIQEGKIVLRCTRPGYEWAGAVFLALPHGTERASLQLLDFSSDFHDSREIQLPQLPPDAYLIAVLKLKANGPLGFRDLESFLEFNRE